MIIWGWGKVTKKFLGQVFQKTCTYCNQTELWQLCLMRTWFTLFFIPIIPYKTRYCVACPKCGSYIELTREQFEQMKFELSNPQGSSTPNYSNIDTTEDDNDKYAGKTEVQINYLKHMEEVNKK